MMILFLYKESEKHMLGRPIGFLGEVYDDVYLLTSLGFPPEFPSTATSYKIKENGDLEPISLTDEFLNAGNCWLEFNQDGSGSIAYSGNSIDGTITSYSVNQETGEIAILERTAAQFELMTITNDPAEILNLEEIWRWHSQEIISTC